MKIQVKRIGNTRLPLPEQHHVGDAGFDLRSTKDVVMRGGDQHIIPCGFAFEIPINYVGIIKDRSSMAKKGLYVGGGIIDSTYRGQVHVMIRNDGNNLMRIDIGDKIAQMLILSCVVGQCVEVDKLPETDRSDNGFGSTGE